jgi:hypothetical protein
MTWLLMWLLLAAGQAKSPAPPPTLDKGYIQDGIYRNDSLGLSYEIPEAVRAKTYLFEQGVKYDKKRKPHSNGGRLLLANAGPNTIRVPHVSDSFTDTSVWYSEEPYVLEHVQISANNEAYFDTPGAATTLLEGTRKFEKGAGFQLLGGIDEVSAGGQKFFRITSKRYGNDNLVTFYAHIATVWKGYLLHFDFSSTNLARLEYLERSIQTITLVDPKPQQPDEN